MQQELSLSLSLSLSEIPQFVFIFSLRTTSSPYSPLPHSQVMCSGEENHHHHHQHNDNSRVSSSSSCPSSTISSSPLVPTPRKKSMEEVWKDISLTNIQDKPTREEGPKSNFRGMILQDFLARPFKEKPTNADIDISLFASTQLTPPPATILSLNSGPDLQCLDTMGIHQYPTHAYHHPLQPLSNQCCGEATSNLSSSFNVGDSPNTPFDAFGFSSSKKRMPESENNSSDRRHKRMIKNRESAARSRARKQAYTNELELEVAHLMEQNAMLRKQQQQLCVAASSGKPPKHTLYRTSTAPF